MYLVQLSTTSKTWEKEFSDPTAAESYRKFCFARYRAKGVVVPLSGSSPVPASTPLTKVAKIAKIDASLALVEAAHLAGREAARACTPVPMVVAQHLNPLDDSSPIIKQWAPIEGGVCGFAWVNVRPANSKVAKILAEKFGAKKSDYEGGMSYSIFEYGQSYERKAAYAQAFARVLSEAGVRAYASSRLD